MRRNSDIFYSENIRIDNADRRCFSNGTEIVSFEKSITHPETVPTRMCSGGVMTPPYYRNG